MKKFTLNNIYILLVCMLTWSCAHQTSDEASVAAEFEYAASSPVEIEDQSRDQKNEDVSEKTERKLIKEGQIEFETKNISDSKKNILQAVNKYGGYISSEYESRYYERVSNSIIIRIPSNNFDSFLADATTGVKKFDNKNIQVKDVTEEFLDVQARLKTKKELENRYLELTKKATTVSELLEIEQQSNNLRSEIESIEGRLKYMSNQVSYSTLSIVIYEKIPGRSDFGGKLLDGFSEGWDNFIQFVIGLISIWPFLILLSATLVAIMRWKKNRKKKKSEIITKIDQM